MSTQDLPHREPPPRNYNSTLGVHNSTLKCNHLYSRGKAQSQNNNHLYTRRIRPKAKLPHNHFYTRGITKNPNHNLNHLYTRGMNINPKAQPPLHLEG